MPARAQMRKKNAAHELSVITSPSNMSGAQAYDPYNPFNDDAQKEQNTQPSNQNLHNLQNTLQETAGIMRNNIEAINQRGEVLEDIDTRANDLSTNAKLFNRSANQVRKDMWKKNLKLKLCLALVIVILLVVIIVPIAIHFRVWKPAAGATDTSSHPEFDGRCTTPPDASRFAHVLADGVVSQNGGLRIGHKRVQLVSVGKPEGTMFDHVVILQSAHNALYHAQDFAQERLTLRGKTKPPHIAQNNDDDPCWEENFFAGQLRGHGGRRQSNTFQQTIDCFFVQGLRIAQQRPQLAVDGFKIHIVLIRGRGHDRRRTRFVVSVTLVV
ncbi:hypothetical protein OGATHE_003442 [Ogataea polymorpha]|uniref:V-SNARE coiled-coil homology domain-containing protein n=1 Tax=Ogataea polymorpha TaxID=460523 RepID=A0A9P8P3L6_9ASCO|nr:hypothetical protein OGATHE_003442 [Ogataea polymorpha]